MPGNKPGSTSPPFGFPSAVLRSRRHGWPAGQALWMCVPIGSADCISTLKNVSKYKTVTTTKTALCEKESPCRDPGRQEQHARTFISVVCCLDWHCSITQSVFKRQTHGLGVQNSCLSTEEEDAPCNLHHHSYLQILQLLLLRITMTSQPQRTAKFGGVWSLF